MADRSQLLNLIDEQEKNGFGDVPPPPTPPGASADPTNQDSGAVTPPTPPAQNTPPVSPASALLKQADTVSPSIADMKSNADANLIDRTTGQVVAGLQATGHTSNFANNTTQSGPDLSPIREELSAGAKERNQALEQRQKYADELRQRAAQLNSADALNTYRQGQLNLGKSKLDEKTTADTARNNTQNKAIDTKADTTSTQGDLNRENSQTLAKLKQQTALAVSSGRQGGGVAQPLMVQDINNRASQYGLDTPLSGNVTVNQARQVEKLLTDKEKAVQNEYNNINKDPSAAPALKSMAIMNRANETLNLIKEEKGGNIAGTELTDALGQMGTGGKLTQQQYNQLKNDPNLINKIENYLGGASGGSPIGEGQRQNYETVLNAYNDYAHSLVNEKIGGSLNKLEKTDYIPRETAMRKLSQLQITGNGDVVPPTATGQQPPAAAQTAPAAAPTPLAARSTTAQTPDVPKQQLGQPNAANASSGADQTTITIKDSQGGTHTILKSNLDKAKQRDPNLTVIGQ